MAHPTLQFFWRLVYKLMQLITINLFVTTIQNTYSYKFNCNFCWISSTLQSTNDFDSPGETLKIVHFRKVCYSNYIKLVDCDTIISIYQELVYNLMSDLIAKIISTTSHGTPNFLLTSLKVLLLFGSLTYFNKIVIQF